MPESWGFDLYPVGGVVPLMEAYRFRTWWTWWSLPRRAYGSGVPVHLFGAGHPMIFALAAAMGCDLFDSAAYALYAREGRYLTVQGTQKLEEMKYRPCSCPVCLKHTHQELMDSPQRAGAGPPQPLRLPAGDKSSCGRAFARALSGTCWRLAAALIPACSTA